MNNTIQEWITKRMLLETLLKYPHRQFTVNELSRISKIPYATAWRFVKKLDVAGVVLCSRIGQSYSCRLNLESPLMPEIKKLLEIKTSPQHAVLEQFVTEVKRLQGIDKIILFGSVAKKQERPTSDVDVAIISGKRNRKLENKVTEIVDDLTRKSKVVIVPLVLTLKELEENKQFKEEVEKGRILYVRHKGS